MEQSQRLNVIERQEERLEVVSEFNETQITARSDSENNTRREVVQAKAVLKEGIEEYGNSDLQTIQTVQESQKPFVDITMNSRNVIDDVNTVRASYKDFHNSGEQSSGNSTKLMGNLMTNLQISSKRESLNNQTLGEQSQYNFTLQNQNQMIGIIGKSDMSSHVSFDRENIPENRQNQ